MVKTHCDVCNKNFKDESALEMHTNAKHKHSDIESHEKGNKSFWIFMAVIVMLFIGTYIYLSSGKSPTGNVTADSVQKITISFKDYNYYPRTITVKQGIPAEITLDSSVGGCFRNFVIKEFGVSKRSSSPQDTIKFTPNKKGSFRFSCSMWMAAGTIVVE